PATQQFLSADPLDDCSGQVYAYAGGSPTNFVDPMGLYYDKPGDARPVNRSNVLAGGPTGLGGGLLWAAEFQNKETLTGQARLGYWDPNRTGLSRWQRSFHLDFEPTYGYHFNADFGPLEPFNHKSVWPWVAKLGSTNALKVIGGAAMF